QTCALPISCAHSPHRSPGGFGVSALFFRAADVFASEDEAECFAAGAGERAGAAHKVLDDRADSGTCMPGTRRNCFCAASARNSETINASWWNRVASCPTNDQCGVPFPGPADRAR